MAGTYFGGRPNLHVEVQIFKQASHFFLAVTSELRILVVLSVSLVVELDVDWGAVVDVWHTLPVAGLLLLTLQFQILRLLGGVACVDGLFALGLDMVGGVYTLEVFPICESS